MSTYCSVDADSHFVLGINCNFDGRVDPFEINSQAVNSGDLALAEPYRKHAHYWLPGDELGGNRAMARRNRSLRTELIGQIGGTLRRRRIARGMSRTSNCRRSTPSTPLRS